MRSVRIVPVEPDDELDVELKVCPSEHPCMCEAYLICWGYSVMIITAGFELADLGLIPSTPTSFMRHSSNWQDPGLQIRMII